MQSRGIFRPGRHAVVQSFTAAYTEETVYPSDWLGISTLAPASQGSSGVVQGETLTLYDYCFVGLVDVDAGNAQQGSQIGVCMGAGIGSVDDIADVSGDSVVADNIVVIQQAGVHPSCRSSDAGALHDFGIVSTVAGEITLNNTVPATGEQFVGYQLLAGISYTGATSETGSCLLIRGCV